ncbi:hypothetical protein Tco_0040690 [Tanacetum coccineum]|uniref:Reverse transcriptase domain-containing protein n=1 Tax=Tanacetum coccineum TaxID=301880 RepID=A0ABQ5FJZ3_9ASTR
MSEVHMREVIREQVATYMAEFMANMNRGASGGGAGGVGAGGARAGGAGLAAPKITGCTYVTFIKCDPQPFKGTKGAMGLCQWFEKLESVFSISDLQQERDKVRKWMTEEFCPRSVLQRLEQEVQHEIKRELKLMEIIQDKTDEAYESEKRKGEGDCGGRGDNRRDYNHRQNQRRANVGAMTNVAPNDNEVCPKCKNKKHAKE